MKKKEKCAVCGMEFEADLNNKKLSFPDKNKFYCSEECALADK